jgi:site-specific DNA-methyltransferase (adenine-specific)
MTDYLNKVFTGDSLSILKSLPDNVVDITVTSPPYNKQKVQGRLVKEVKYQNSEDAKDEWVYQDEQIEILNEVYRITKPGGHIFYNHKLRWFNGVMLHPMTWLSKSKWNIRQELIWDRTIAGNIRGWRFWQVEERIYWMQKGISIGDELESKHAKMTSIWRIRPDSNSVHPAPFPIELPTRCIYSIADLATGFTVLDPYCGSGTTLAAAKMLDHNYIGIDVSSEYSEMAIARLEGAEDATRVALEANLHNVKKSYKDRKNKMFSKT